jgi:hypothetical protein
MVSFKRWLFLLVILPGIIASCNKLNDLSAISVKSGKVGFYNVIPNSGAVDFYINGTRQNPNKIAYGDYSGYINISSGQQSVLFKSDSLRNDLIPVQTVNILTDSTTIFVTGTQNAPALFFARDTAKADKNIKPKLRFINVSSDAPAFDVALNSVSIVNQAYKSISAFARVDTGKVVLRVNISGTNTTVKSTTYILSSNGVYTLFAYGSYKSGSTAGLNFRLVTNH